ncbi:MAG TPA: pyridoxal phosphate-dependent aminotransferase [Gaiellaceae bacterium]|jgi:aspartate/methionine/tyrosine aminotransferase|nr:pyridoxal phosphate-dependent aminotransferase [Gaiellaceae bacterium]
MIRKAQRMELIRGFGIDRVAAAADAGGRSILRMENLDTDLPLPPEAIPVTTEGLDTPEANSWLPFTGDLDLRAAISDFTAERSGHRYDPQREIVITVGGMEGLLNALLALVDPGDELIVTDPTYAGIVNRIRLAGGTPRFVPFVADEDGWRFDRDGLARVVGSKTTGFLLMSPSMPSGGYLDENDWHAVCELCRERDLFLVYDAAMERLLFDGRPLIHPLRIEGMAERTLVVGSLSKEHRMIGWRVGWVAGPEETITDVGWAHVYNTTTPVSIARRAATAVLRGDQGHVAECVAELERRRDAMLEGLPGWPFVKPAGGWSMLLDVAQLGFEPEEASQILLDDAQIAATGMRGWGDEFAARYVRFVFSAERVERLNEIPERLAGTRLEEAVAARL